MAVLHKKEEKIAVVLSKLPTDYTDKQFVEKFIEYILKTGERSRRIISSNHRTKSLVQ